MLGIVLEMKNKGSEIIHIQRIELWLLDGDGNLWPTKARAIKLLEVGQSIAPNQSKKTLFILDEQAPPSDGSQELHARIIRINGFPHQVD